ncbi:DinB family protein [Tenacibaculum soleae]|uniref:DinB family protein n=1 Tax=Tenacibaculum soleae TaxID=447689 RepID=UPI0026E18588|nr:DinB family protein [Tenacibaculum soleae]MDO6745476.1 DinB family protein [Tenacibaculum soleae]
MKKNKIMVYNSSEVIKDLILMTTSHINYAKKLVEVSGEKLQHKKSSKSWSVLECLEHLNRYAFFYNIEINKKMSASSLPFSETFKSGFLGNKFANDMLPKEGMKTMNTFKSKNPNNSKLNKERVLLDFIALQEELLDLLEVAKNKNVDKIKTKTTLPLVKFRLGDTLRFVIHHNERHIVQAKKALI